MNKHSGQNFQTTLIRDLAGDRKLLLAYIKCVIDANNHDLEIIIKALKMQKPRAAKKKGLMGRR